MQPVAAAFDTVGIAFPADDFDRDAFNASIQRADRPVGQETYRYDRPLPGGGFIGCGVGNAAWIEASLPKRLDPEGLDNSVALDLDGALSVLSDMYRACQQYVEISPGHLFEESKVVRLDLVRDFHGVDRQTELLDGLAAVVQPGRSKVRRFADPSANRAETLRVGPRAWGCTLYDKHTETRGRAPEGQVRFEARLHRDQLTSVFARNNGGHFRTVGDLVRVRLDGQGDGGSALARAQRAWFDRVGFDQAIPAAHELVRSVMRSGLSARQVGQLWSFLTLPGFAAALSRNTRAKYRREVEALGVCPRFDTHDLPELIDARTETTLRLDYDRGCLVAA